MENMWKDIPGYEGLYQSSSLGEIRSVDREDRSGRRVRGVVLSPAASGGYGHVNLVKDGKRKTVLVHRMVAETFLPNEQGLREVNHINENKLDNHVENLEWCTRKQNIMHGTGIARCSASRRKRVIQRDRNKNLVGIYTSVEEAAVLTGVSMSYIYACCNGSKKPASGSLWGYLRGDCA